MKPKSALRNFLALAGSSLLAVSSASAATFTWTQATTGSQTWGTASNWLGGTASDVFTSGSGNELAFSFTGVAGNATTITGVPSTLLMNVLTLAGTGPNSTLGSSILIGDNTSTWTIGDLTTSTVNLNSALGGGSSDRDVRYTIAANLELSGGTSGITLFQGASTSGTGAVFSGNITETVSGKGITKSGASLLIFSGSNSYTGTTLVSAGTLRLSSANALSGSLGATGGTSALTISGTGVVELGASNFQRNLGTGSNQFQMTAGGTNTSGFSAFGGPRVITVNNDASQELVWGSGGFNPGKLLLNAATANNSLELANKIDLNTATRTVVVNADKALLSGDIRTASGTAGLTKEGAGALVLTGANSYNGTTTVTGGTLSIGASNNLGTATSLVLNGTSTSAGGTIQIRGTALTSFTSLATSVAVTATRAVGFDIQDVANTFTVNQALNQTTGNFTKSGAGTLVLNQNNTYTGATTATGGGTLVLDYTTNNGSKLSDTAALTLNGSALVLKGGVGVGFNHNEVVSATTITGNTSSSISRDGGTSTISLGAITTSNGSSLSISESNIATTSTANATVSNPSGGILSLGRVTAGSHFGANDGSGNIVAYSGYNAVTTAGGSTTGFVNQLTGGGTMAATLSSYALRIVNSGGSDVLTLDTNVDLILVNNSTFLYAGGSNNEYTINGSATSEMRSGSGNQPFIINTATGTKLTINTGFSTSGGGFSKAGSGTLVVGGDASAMTGSVYVQQGVFRMASATGAGGVAGALSVQGGAALELSSNITVGAKALAINGTGISNGGALRSFDGSNIYGGQITIGASGARINADASSSLELRGGIATTLTQDVTFGGDGNTTVSTAAITGSGNLIKDGAGTLTLSAANTYTGNTTISAGSLEIGGSGTLGNVSAGVGNYTGNISIDSTSSGKLVYKSSATQTLGGVVSGAGALTVENGTLSLSKVNTYTGATTVTAGTLAVNGAGSINTSAVTVNGGTFRYNSSVAYSGTLTFTSGSISGTNLTGSLDNLTIGTGQILSPGNSPGTATTGSQTWAGGGTYAWEINDANATAGADPGWDLENGTGTLTITATSGSKFNLNLYSLSLLNAAGALTDFNNANSYNWLIADFTNPISGFAADAFNIDLTNFTNNNTINGTFAAALGDTVGGDNSQIYLTYTAIPEPRAALLGGLGMLMLLRRRRK